MAEQKILHLITQDDQPYMSRRKCCQECGSVEWNCDKYVDAESDFTKEAALKNNLIRCVDK